MNSIARHLQSKKKSQQKFADECRVSQPTVNAWVNGTKRPEGENVNRVAEVLGVDPAEILLEFHLDKTA